MPGYAADATQLMHKMSTAWATFARTGDPNHPGLPAWPAYAPTDRSVMVFETDCRLVAAPRRAEYEAWADVDGASVGVIA
jgi:para-nitrobenzyl esterase